MKMAEAVKRLCELKRRVFGNEDVPAEEPEPFRRQVSMPVS